MRMSVCVCFFLGEGGFPTSLYDSTNASINGFRRLKTGEVNFGYSSSKLRELQEERILTVGAHHYFTVSVGFGSIH